MSISQQMDGQAETQKSQKTLPKNTRKLKAQLVQSGGNNDRLMSSIKNGFSDLTKVQIG